MSPLIDNPSGLHLSSDAVLVLQRIFANYKRVIIIKEFAAGLSGSRVLEVRPIKIDGTPELPTVVKLATISMIRQEWRAYQQHIHNRLPHVASTSRPTLLSTTGWGGLRYPVMGGGNFDIMSLRDFCRQPDLRGDFLQTVLDRLFRIMDNVWGFHSVAPDFALHTSYDLTLPPHLLIRQAAVPPDIDITLLSPRDLSAGALQPGDAVAISDVMVQKVDPATRIITLCQPATSAEPSAYRVRVRIPDNEPMPSYASQQIIDLVVGFVVETRASRLKAEVAGLGIDPAASHVLLAEQVHVSNPLHMLPVLLNQSRNVNIATIHGDFNLENILVEPQLGDISLIDFANARQDHVLHDLLHLEAEVITHMLPDIIYQHHDDPILVLVELGWHLHRAMLHPTYEPGLPERYELQKPWIILRAIRRAARRYVFDLNDFSEYYQGLVLYLLGALRYKNLSQHPHHPLPKRIAFWAATLACQWLTHHDVQIPPPALAPLLLRSRLLWTSSMAAHGEAHAVTSRIGAHLPEHRGQVDLLGSMPLDRIPPCGALPPGSRLLLERNPRFVGRREQLSRLAAGLKSDGSGKAMGKAMVIVGLGGVGKTQLACEFAHRFGRFFAGGVFWLSSADPHAFVAEVAACGDRGAMGLRVNFGELPLEEQVQLVMAEWQKPIPRLLIFDNCESPELLARWLPQSSGCRVLLTSRRADWEATLGIRTLVLDVLPRADSLALLQAHQPDIDRSLLNEIAHELGDLPLALHLAGSYLARYRYTIDAASYLDSLRHTSPLSHQSLQEGSLSPTEHDSNVARTFAYSYDQLDQDEPTTHLARTLIHAAACLSPGEPIPELLAHLALEAHNKESADVVRAGFQLGGAMNQLVELGLMRAEANHTLSIHRLVSAFTRERLGARLEETQLAVERALLAEANRLNAAHDLAQLRGWHVHLRFLTDTALLRGDADSAALCHTLAEHLYQTGDYRGAHIYHERAFHIRQAVLGQEHQATARSLTELGKALLFFGDVERARPHLERALTIQIATLGDHDDTAMTLNHLGFLLQRQGQLSAAQPYHEHALHIRQSVLGVTHPAVVESMCNLAYIEYAQARLGTAQALLQQALAIQRHATGDEHPETARVLTNLGELFRAQNRLEEADRVLSQALVIQERELGVQHPETARILVILGDVRRLSGNMAQAQHYYERALIVFQACHGRDHSRTKHVLAQLAALYAEIA